jgi:hypothetical protein
MPRFAHIFEAAADTLNAYYQAVAEVNIDSLMGLWIDEEFVSCICADGSVVYAIAEAHRPVDPKATPAMVFTTYVMVHERGEWRIAHIHASPMPNEAASQFATKMRHGQGSLH